MPVFSMALLAGSLCLSMTQDPLVGQTDKPVDLPQCPANQIATSIGCLDRPKLVHKTEPKYPRKARHQGMQGTVLLFAVLRTDGSIGEVQIKESRPAGVGFEESAIKAVKDWRYEPIVHEGKPISVWFSVRVNFELTRD